MFPVSRWIRFPVWLVVAWLCLPGMLPADESQPEDAAVAVTQAVLTTKTELATEHMVGVYYGHVAGSTEARLQNSGLAQPEIDSIVDSVAQEFADCVVSSLVKADAAETDFTIEMLADGAPIDEVSTYMDSLSAAEGEDPLIVFEAEFGACSAGVDARYGLD